MDADTDRNLEVALRCPNCSKDIAEGTQICPHCDHILDASFLGEIPDNNDDDAVDDDEATGADRGRGWAAPITSENQPAVKPRRPSTGERAPSPPKRSNAPTNRPSGSRARVPGPSDMDSGRNNRTSRSVQTMQATQEPAGGIEHAPDHEAMLKNAWSLLLSLPFEEKIEAFASLAQALMLFMPWRALAGDDDLGLITWGGFWTLMFTGGTMGLFYLRHSQRIRKLTPLMLSQAELIVSGVTMLVITLFIITSINRHPVGGRAGDVLNGNIVYVSMPEFGSYFALMLAAGVTLGAALCYNRIKRETH